MKAIETKRLIYIESMEKYKLMKIEISNMELELDSLINAGTSKTKLAKFASKLNELRNKTNEMFQRGNEYRDYLDFQKLRSMIYDC